MAPADLIAAILLESRLSASRRPQVDALGPPRFSPWREGCFQGLEASLVMSRLSARQVLRLQVLRLQVLRSQEERISKGS